MLRSDPRALLIAGLLALAPAAPARANEVGVGGAARGLVIHDAVETLRDHCVRDAAGILWFRIPGGSRFELVTSVDDPAITNHGDGAFHPFDPAEVRRALNEVRFPLADVRADVFILPYPRRHGLESAAGPELILLSPGVRPLTSFQQHAELVHELGHVVQYAIMPDDRADAWSSYRRLRGIQDPETYSASSIHANRPHEIFAEDFRALFGGASANESGTVENSQIAPPRSVGGLDRFMLALGGAPVPELELTVASNPARGRLRFSQAGGTAAALDLFDAAGRRLATLAPRPAAGLVEWQWDGPDAGRRMGPAVVFARVRGAAGGALRVVLLP